MGHVANLRAAVRRTKSIDDPLLNRLGLQVARTVAARSVARARRVPRPARAEVGEWAAQLATAGCLEVPDFLSEADFAAVESASRRSIGPGGAPQDHLHDGANTVDVVWRHDLEPGARADLDRFFLHPDVLDLAAAAERVQVRPGAGRCVLQLLTQHPGEPDAQAALHSDTFHPTHKFWLYLTDVREEDGPLVYHPGSHRLSLASLRGTYRESNADNAGSRRIPPAEVAARRLKPTVFLCRANTLVAADTAGYHGRIQGSPPWSRLALQIELRPDPFRRGGALAEDRSVSRATLAGRTDPRAGGGVTTH